jgi:hypothetical protein
LDRPQEALDPVPTARGAQAAPDPQRYVGLHGTAVLCRYPIVRADLHRLDTPYDWFGAEQRIGPVERFRRWSAQRVFAERIVPEVRHGSRLSLVVSLAVPDLPGGEVAVVATHLENKCTPACRRRQRQQLLANVRDVSTPVILAGDLNTTGRDASPTSAWRNIRQRLMPPQFSFGWLHGSLSPTALPRLLLLPANHTRGYLDPTRKHVPVFSSNPEAGLFRAVERFRFEDGGAFEFRESAGAAPNPARHSARPTRAGVRDFGPRTLSSVTTRGWSGSTRPTG